MRVLAAFLSVDVLSAHRVRPAYQSQREKLEKVERSSFVQAAAQQTLG